MQFGPIIRTPAARIFSTRAASRTRPASGADHDERLHPFREAVIDDRLDARRRNDDHGEIHVTGDIRHPGVGRERLDLGRVEIDRIDRTGKAGGAQVVEDFGADPAACSIRPHHGDRARLEKGLHRSGGRVTGAAGRLLRGLRGRRERQPEGDDPRFRRLLDLEAEVDEYGGHLAIPGQDRGFEGLNAPGDRNARETVDQARADSQPVERVGDGECRLGALRSLRIAKKMPERDDSGARFADERKVVSDDDLRQIVEAACGTAKAAGREAVTHEAGYRFGV